MLLTQEKLKTLKKVNVSKNADKTKERVQADFKAASKEERKAILEISGQVINSVYRVYNTGSVNARIVLAMAQALNVQPWYYTGEIDDKTPLDDGQLLQFLKVHGYDALLKEINKSGKPKRKYDRKPKTETVITESAVAELDEHAALDSDANGENEETMQTPLLTAANLPPDVERVELETEAAIEMRLLFSDEPQMKKAVEDLTEQEAAELLHTLFIRAKGGGEAAHIAEVVKRCLLK